MWNRRRHAVTVRFIEFCYRLSSVILNSFIITCVVRHFNCPESKIRGHIVFALSVCLCQRLGRGYQCFTNASCSVLKSFCIRHFVFFLILLLEWQYVSFMMISCIFWIGPTNSWVFYLNYAVHIYANKPCMGIFLQTILYAHKSSKGVPCKGIGAWFKTQ